MKSLPFLFSFLILAPLVAKASEPASTPSLLTLDEALQRVLAHHPALDVWRAEERAAEGLVEQAGLAPAPTLDVTLENVLGTGDLQGVRQMEATVLANQVWERGGKRERRVALAKREQELMRHEAQAEAAILRREVALAYVQVVAAQSEQSLALELADSAELTLRTVEERVAAGAASPTEAVRARALARTARGEVLRASAASQAARRKLAASWGAPNEISWTVALRWNHDATVPEAAVWESALAEHPSLLRQAVEIERKRAELEVERARGVQDVTVGGGVRFVRENSDAAWIVGVSVPLARRERNQGAVRSLREQIVAAEQRREALRWELRGRFHELYEQVLAARAQSAALRREVLPAAEEAVTLVREAFDHGQLGFLDVQEAQRALLTNRREVLAAEIESLKALVQLESLVDPSFRFTRHLFAQP